MKGVRSPHLRAVLSFDRFDRESLTRILANISVALAPKTRIENSTKKQNYLRLGPATFQEFINIDKESNKVNYRDDRE